MHKFCINQITLFLNILSPTIGRNSFDVELVDR